MVSGEDILDLRPGDLVMAYYTAPAQVTFASRPEVVNRSVCTIWRSQSSFRCPWKYLFSFLCFFLAFFCLIFSSLDSIPSFDPKHAKMCRFIVEQILGYSVVDCIGAHLQTYGDHSLPTGARTRLSPPPPTLATCHRCSPEYQQRLQRRIKLLGSFAETQFCVTSPRPDGVTPHKD